ncbi:hypothetical protein [Sphingobium sp. CFD-2]|uniref:hypothetical protein n=1 Tax=Sphingobium sp. CFD-2 TaxID=2878542 RepID=UPI00214CE218|nr:hypothetical protein [Sphingobium sp. CFD-2]
MALLKILVEGVALTVGSVMTSLLMACLVWQIALGLHCRRQAWMMLVGIAVAAFVALGASEFVRMSAILGLAAAAVLYLQGTDERSARRRGGASRNR